MFSPLLPLLVTVLALIAPAPAAETAGPSPVMAAEAPAPQLPTGTTPLQSQGSETARPGFELHPGIALLDVGVDNNIMGSQIAPQQDTVGQLWLRAAPTLQAGAVTLGGTASLGLSYFQQHSEQRSVDTKDAFLFDYRLNRVSFYGTDNFVRTRDIFTPELDQRLPRMENTADAGVRFQATGKTLVGAGVRHARFDFPQDQVSTAALRNSLTRAEDSFMGSVRSALTPLTTLVVMGDLERDRFDFATFRDGNGARILGGFEFKPSAFISGNAYVGYRTRTSMDGSYPDASALVASLDLGYLPWQAVRLGLKINRDLDHSLFENERYYLLTDVSGSITVRFAEGWEVGGTLGRQRLNYAASSVVDPVTGQPAVNAGPWDEHVLHLTGIVGYHFGQAAVLRFTPDYIRRDSQLALRSYDRLRLVSSITIGFD